MLRAVTFDVTHTLLQCPALGEQYAEVLARHGVRVAPRDVEATIPLVWQELACSASPARDRFAAHPRGAAGFWQHFVERTCDLLGATRPSRFATRELYDRFAHAEAWQVEAGARATLGELKLRGLKLGVVSNWDERLPLLLERVGLATFFDVVAVSSLVGVEKPHPGIFRFALERLGVAPEEAMHVGDSQRDDVEGAEGAGMSALRLDPGGGADLTSLAELPAALARNAGR